MRRALLPLVLIAACTDSGGGDGDALLLDAAVRDARAPDTVSLDASPPDGAPADGPAPDARCCDSLPLTDGQSPDAAQPDAITPDARLADAASPDAGRPELACPLSPALVCDGAAGFVSGMLSRAACPPDVECEDDGCCWQSRWQDFRLAVYLVHPETGAVVEMTVCEERALRDELVAAGDPLPPFTWRVAADSAAFEPGDAVHVYTSDLGDWGSPLGENGDCYSRIELVVDAARRACVDGQPRAFCQ